MNADWAAHEKAPGQPCPDRRRPAESMLTLPNARRRCATSLPYATDLTSGTKAISNRACRAVATRARTSTLGRYETAGFSIRDRTACVVLARLARVAWVRPRLSLAPRIASASARLIRLARACEKASRKAGLFISAAKNASTVVPIHFFRLRSTQHLHHSICRNLDFPDRSLLALFLVRMEEDHQRTSHDNVEDAM